MRSAQSAGRRLRWVPVAVGLLILLAVIRLAWGATGPGAGHRLSPPPVSPPVQVCGDPGTLSGPASAPSGAVVVPPGDDSGVLSQPAPGRTYWFAPGSHTVDQSIIPASGDVFVGAPGAVLDGRMDVDFAFQQPASDVTVEYLTVQHFTPPINQGAVNASAAQGWTVEHDTIRDNSPGTGLYLGSRNVAEYDCITANGQQGFGSYTTYDVSPLTGGGSHLTVSHNEISFNDTCNVEGAAPDPVPSAMRPPNCEPPQKECGCTAGGKFWQNDQAVVADNYVHDNYSVGLWADTNNTGFDMEGNYFARNYDSGLIYEISYNALIAGNTFVDNGNGKGPTDPGFPTGAVFVSESGGDGRVPGFASGSLSVTGNVFTDNWGGVVLWEDSNRFCSDGYDEVCTLVEPRVYTLASCGAHLPEARPGRTPDYYDNCRWKTQNVRVTGNRFDLDPAAVGPSCTAANACGLNGLFSVYGSLAPYRGWATDVAISDDQHNVFADNSYRGPWSFVGFSEGDLVGTGEWTRGFTDTNGSNGHFDGQDTRSTLGG